MNLRKKILLQRKVILLRASHLLTKEKVGKRIPNKVFLKLKQDQMLW